jgi:hypothetical protein
MKCICHSIALSSSKACSNLSSGCETLVKKIFAYIRNNFKKQQRFDKLITIYDIEPLKLINTSDTRWLSLEAVVSRILHLWEPLKDFFLSEIESTKVEKPNEIYAELKNPDSVNELSIWISTRKLR